MNQDLAGRAAALTPRALEEMERLVAVSSPSGDHQGAERAIALCSEFFPSGARIERLPCSTRGSSADLLALIDGDGDRRLLLLGHLDTVVGHAQHVPLRRDGERLYGSGTADMKGGDALALALARALAQNRGRFAQLAVLMVCDEEWRTAPFHHVERFAGYDACLCFEAGERSPTGDEAVIVRRKGAGTLRVSASGRAAHSGVAPEKGRNALLALAQAATALAALSAPDGPDRMTVVPTIIRSGDALNVVPAAGELIVDIRASDTSGFTRVRDAVPGEVGGATLHAELERVWPAMDTEAATAPLLSAASKLLGEPIVARARGGASDASHFAPKIPLTLDGLGPCGGDAHNPGEFVIERSIGERLAVALAIADAILPG